MRGWLRDIPGFEGRYAVDMGGNVYSYRKGDYLKPGAASGGHLTVSLGARNSRSVHELVLTTFIGPRPSPNHVSRHLDGVKLNNSIFNLEWSTYSQNAIDKKYLGEQGDRLSISEVIRIKELLSTGASGVQISIEFGIAQSTVSAIRKGLFHRDV